ncbi:hypothetical protein GCM10023189_24200 [Nibrella saemangeumensis]|uniref:histidine kinase n=1 Tax=Nibrella saemangeumensis TaxID=1084526 RepID=A0ABP8MXD2_9BACT
MAELFNKLHRADSSLYYAHLALINSKQANNLVTPSITYFLARLYKDKNNLDSAFHYLEIARASSDSLFGPRKIQQLQLLAIAEKQRQQELILAQKEYQNQVRFYAVLTGLGVLVLLALILWRNNRQKHRANELLQQKNGEIQRTLIELKTTQAQLIQREKMASLGELTAGIAHEIQNPLNFVNNLSEVSTELVGELKEEAKAGHIEDVLELADDLQETLEKVNHHGKRADGIVKGMLQHSKTSSGTKEPTDLNALANEYLRLAYQNLKAKDDSFTADLRLSLDPNLGLINVAPQDMGRVLLNLYNNAFYATQEQARKSMDGFQPQIEVTTHRENGRVELRVKDNGTGIPSEILNKIYQPFFTTKPTGQGTGLGLSLSYDIVTKGHGGEMIVDSQENTYTEFVVTLPTSNGL